MEKVISPSSQSKSREPVHPPEVGLSRRKNYQAWSKEELVREIQKLEKRKKYGLVWEDKPEQVAELCKEQLPILIEEKGKGILTDSSEPTNILIEGDNYHALSVLNYTHKGKIDVIYIDPPFNTGSQSWKYNNDYVEKDDAFWHSKWLSFMEKRLRLAKPLLKNDGAIIVAIDDYEVNHLGVLLEEIFPAYERDLIIVIHHPQGAGSETISRVHEYAYVCTPKGIGLKGRKTTSEEDRWSLKRSGQGENNWRVNRRKQFFAVHVDEKTRKVIGIGPELPKDKKDYPKGKTAEGYVRIYPIDREGKERVWRYNRPTMTDLIKAGLVEYTEKGSLVIKKQGVNAVPVFSVWQGARYNAGTYGSSLLTEIMGTANTFPYPKSLYTVADMLAIIIGNDRNALVLDFFAGSGTTGHAVLEMNKDDGGKRKSILCTNNENNICTEVCLPRMAKVIKGYKNGKGQKVEGLGGNLKYFATDFVDAAPTDRNKKRLVDRSTEMLCLKEDCFDEVKRTADYAIFKNGEGKHLGIVYDDDGIDPFKKEAKRLNRKLVVYVFSLDESAREEEFKDVEKLVEPRPIPAVILNVYRRIFR